MQNYYIIEKDNDLYRVVGIYPASSPHDALLQKVASRHGTYTRMSMKKRFAAISEKMHSSLFTPPTMIPTHYFKDMRTFRFPVERKKGSQKNSTYYLFLIAVNVGGGTATYLNKKYVAISPINAIYKLGNKNPEFVDGLKKNQHVVAVLPEVYNAFMKLKYTLAGDIKKEADDKYEEQYYA